MLYFWGLIDTYEDTLKTIHKHSVVKNRISNVYFPFNKYFVRKFHNLRSLVSYNLNKCSQVIDIEFSQKNKK